MLTPQSLPGRYGRLKDQADVIELIRTNRDELAVVRKHLEQVHASYVATFERLIMMADNGG